MPDFQLVDPSTKLFTPEQRQFLELLKKHDGNLTDPALSNRFCGLALIVLHEVCGLTLEQAWAVVRPRSKSTDHTAKCQASRMIRYYRQRYPLTWREAFEVTGLTTEYLVQRTHDMMNAKRLRWDNDDGCYIETKHDDWHAVNAALGRATKFMELDKEVREQSALGVAEKPSRLDLPPKFATPQEWEVWAKSQEKEVLASRTQAAKEMRAIAEGHRAQRKEAATEPEPEKQPDWPP